MVLHEERLFFVRRTRRACLNKDSKQSAQLLLDKVGDLIYLHKIF